MSELVLYEALPPAVIVTLNRPDKRNALSRGLIQSLADAFTRASDDKTARCVILAAAGPVFCAGMDLAELQETLSAPKESTPVWDDALRLAKLYDLIYTFPKPTIAAVQGSAVAGGAGLVTVCDLAIAAPDAKFGYPEVRRGLVAAMVMPHLLRHVGERMARYLLLTGELIDAKSRTSNWFCQRSSGRRRPDGTRFGARCRLRRRGPPGPGENEGVSSPVFTSILVNRRGGPSERFAPRV